MHPPIESFAHGWLTRPDGAEIHWETSGNPGGRPALYLHGGPGGGLGAGGYRRRFDPERYLVVGLDRRGCGRSRPLVIDDLAGLDGNTTQALLADIEALREHLGIDTWLVHGVQWGSSSDRTARPDPDRHPVGRLRLAGADPNRHRTVARRQHHPFRGQTCCGRPAFDRRHDTRSERIRLGYLRQQE